MHKEDKHKRLQEEMTYTKAEYTVVMLSASWVVGIKCKNHLQFRGSSITPGCQREEVFERWSMRDTHELDRQKKWDGDVKSPGKVKKRDNTMEVGRKGWETVNIEKKKRLGDSEHLWGI